MLMLMLIISLYTLQVEHRVTRMIATCYLGVVLVLGHSTLSLALDQDELRKLSQIDQLLF